MDQEQRQQCQQTADRMTVFCLLSLVIGAYIIWVNLDQSASETGSILLPVTVVTIVHLLGGSIAVFNAKKTGNFTRNIPVYGYFLLSLVLVILVVSNGGKFY